MNLTVPLYVETSRPPKSDAPVYTARPLFFGHPERRGENLQRVMGKLALDLKNELETLSRQGRQEALASYAFCPDLHHQSLAFTLELRRRTAKCRFLVVTLKSLGRKLAFTPSLPDLWFEVARGEDLHDRAVEVLTRHFRDQEKDEDDAMPEALSLAGKAWVTTLELAVQPAQVFKPPEVSRFAFLGEPEPVDGARELRRVGRCLDWLYPDDLDRVRFRDREVAEVTRLLTAPDRRPLLLVGPPQVGKTAILHEYVYQTVARRRSAYANKENVWLLSPPRLISGMSYVGQWENRLLAILKEARKRRHILYFDDLLGLFHAGVSSSSSLSVAQVLKPYIERREVRLVAEITPEAFRVFRERDRGFADLFHVLPVAEPSEEEVLRILIAAQRQLEGQTRCRFDPEVLPTVLDLQRRYVRGVAFPGKAAGFLRRLAVKGRNVAVSRDQVLQEFHAQSGLAVKLLDSRVKLERPEVLEALRQQVIGQDAALEAAADVVAIAKARLNDPDRPLASFLFLGPTGVGKTQCAKSLAAFLFGDADRVVRFDLNEFVSSESVARLVGTFYQPEGLLTSAVRRQPFAVVLLDEIEKAHPDVFDLLLQVLGEGRLTDALGRTVDFTNTILILTSNLGVRAAEGRFGFQAGEADGGVFVQAAEKFFRPEFFNRLDRIVPFGRLNKEDVGHIARLLIQEVFRRDGLLRRKCVLHVDDRALDRVVEKGYDALLGARALKRAVEQQLTQPVAARLAALRPETLTVVSLYPGREGLAVQVQGLQDAPHLDLSDVDRRDVPALLKRIATAVARIERQTAHLRPEGPLTLGQVAPEHYHYFLLREQMDWVRTACRELGDRLDAARSASLRLPALPHERRPRTGKAQQMYRRRRYDLDRLPLAELAAAEDIHAYLLDLAADASQAGDVEEDLEELLRQTALLQLMADAVERPSGERALVVLRALDASAHKWVATLWLRQVLMFREHGMGGDALIWDPSELQGVRPLVIHGPHAEALAKLEEGTHLVCPAHQNLVPVQLQLVPLAEGQDPKAAFSSLLESQHSWLDRLAHGQAALEDNPLPLLPVLRIYDEQGPTVDLRTGLISPSLPDGVVLWSFLLSALPLPPELRA